MLRQGEELLDFWFGEHNLVEVLWPVIFKIGDHKLDQLADFVKEPNNATFARALMGDAVSQLALHKPDRRPDAIEWFEDLFQFFLDNTEDERLIDTQVISLFVWHATDINATELEELIGKLYENDLVETGMVGPYQQVVDEITIEGYKGAKLPVGDIWREYEKFIDTRDENAWPDILEESTDFGDLGPTPDDLEPSPTDDSFSSSGDDHFDPSGNGNQPFKSSDEPGRNDPCPCGSGKKYKHCCME